MDVPAYLLVTVDCRTGHNVTFVIRRRPLLPRQDGDFPLGVKAFGG